MALFFFIKDQRTKTETSILIIGAFLLLAGAVIGLVSTIYLSRNVYPISYSFIVSSGSFGLAAFCLFVILIFSRRKYMPVGKPMIVEELPIIENKKEEPMIIEEQKKLPVLLVINEPVTNDIEEPVISQKKKKSSSSLKKKLHKYIETNSTKESPADFAPWEKYMK
jgi:hypothetical protein